MLNNVWMMDGRYMSRNVAVTMNRVNVVRMLARRSWVCCRSRIRCVSPSNADGRRADEMENARAVESRGSIEETVDRERWLCIWTVSWWGDTGDWDGCIVVGANVGGEFDGGSVVGGSSLIHWSTIPVDVTIDGEEKKRMRTSGRCTVAHHY